MAKAPEALPQAGLPHSQGKSKQASHSFSVTLALQERASAFRFVCHELRYCGENTWCIHLDPGPRGQKSHFSPGEP